MRRGRTKLRGARCAAAVVALVVSCALVVPASALAFEPLIQAGSGGSGAGQISGAYGLGSDDAGNVYLADIGNVRIDEFAGNGDFKLGFGYDTVTGGGTGFEVCTLATGCKAGTSGGAAGQFTSPFDVAANPAGSQLTVAEVGAQRISQFGSAPDFQHASGYDVIPGGGVSFEICTTATTCKVGVGGIGPGQLASPFSAAYAPSGDIYVVDGSGRVSEYGPDGSFVRTFGTAGSGPGGLSSPQGVTVDSAGNVYAADIGNQRVAAFSATGAFLRAWGFDVIPGGGTGFEVCTTTTNCKAGVAGPGAGQLAVPWDIATGPGDQLYVAEQGNNRISQFDTAGNFVSSFGYDVIPGGGTGFEICTTATTCKAGTSGTGFGQMTGPQGVTVDCRGNVWVSDAGNARLIKYGDPAAAPPPCPKPVVKPTNAFSFGKVKLNKKKGTATLEAKLPGPGDIKLSGKGVAAIKRPADRRARAVSAAGTVKLTVKAKGKTKKTLKKKGKAKVKVTVTFTPTGGDPNPQVKKLTLKKTRPKR